MASAFGFKSGGTLSLAALWVVHQLAVLLLGVGGATGQGLIPVPDTVTRELGTYYLSKFGLAGEHGLDYYGLLLQRNAKSNVYKAINNISDADSPRTAAAKISGIRGLYKKHALGGGVKVESFYRLFRCEDQSCFAVNRIIATPVNGSNGTVDVLSYVKTAMGATGWLVNAAQSVMNLVLEQPDEQQTSYVDPIYRTQLFYKVAALPPCSSALPQTMVGSIAELFNTPGFACVNVGGTLLLVGTSQPEMVTTIQRSGVPFAQCDGSLGMAYTLTTNSGPRIVRVIRKAGSVPLSVTMDLPPFTADCAQLYNTPDLSIKAAQAILTYNSFVAEVNLALAPLATVASLGFTGKCAPLQFFSTYGVQLFGQREELTDGSTNRTLLGSFAPYSAAGACVAMMGVNQPDEFTIDSDEDRCAELFLGNQTQKTEGIVTYWLDDPGAQPTAGKQAGLQSQCEDPTQPRYKLDISVVLPQIAADFESDKNLLVSSTEVKLHLDGVAANAASVVAVEAALVSSGTIVARTIACSGLYRRRHLPSSVARGIALLVTGVVVTLFNIPNFALIDRSLSNHGKAAAYTQASVRIYRPSNYSAFLRAETHSFVEVTGSSLTAILGLLLYCATLIFCLYVTWAEFTKIIYRREQAESRLGQEALIEDSDLLIEWRKTDSLVYDTLHPKKVVEAAQAQELEFMRHNLVYANPGDSSRVLLSSPRATPLVQRANRTKAHGEGPEPNDTPDLYPDV